MHSIVVADPLSEQALTYLEQTPGISVSRCFEKGVPDLTAALAEADALIVRSETRVNSDLLGQAPRLKAVGRAGVGVDNIDLEGCTARGVLVMNTPGGNSIAVIELTFAHLLLTARPVTEAVISMKNGEWNRKAFSGSELHGKTLAVFGCGKIGSGVASRAKAFGMKVVVYDPFLSNARASALGVEKVELDAALGAADFISLHLPLTDETRGFIDREKLAQVRPGLRLVNCSRGEVVVEEDLLQALDDETDFSDLLRLETFDASGRSIMAIDGTLHGKRRSPRIVAIDHREIEIVPEGWLLFIRNDDKPGAIGRIGNVLGRHDVNVANMALARTGPGDALTVLALDGEPPKAAFRELLGQPDIRSAQLLHINLQPVELSTTRTSC